MKRVVLRDDQWERLKDLLPGKAGDCGVTAADNRLFVEAVLWIARTGSPWRDLPDCFGHWHRVTMRYNRWSHKGTWATILAAVSDDPDLEYLMVDGSIVRVHPHGAAQKNSSRNRPWGNRAAA
jgi:transposase